MNNCRSLRHRWAVCAVYFFLSLSTFAGLKLPALFSDHMVLQAGQEDACWGWAPAGDEVKVSFVNSAGETKATGSATAGSDGRWSLKLPVLSSGEKGTLQIRSGSSEITITDVLIGEVWLGSGQSNMERAVSGGNVPQDMADNAKKEAAAAQPNIRFFYVTKFGADRPEPDVQGRWLVVTPEVVGKCSATAWYFAQSLRERIGAPVGMIVSCWGGTPVEGWTPREAIDATSVGASIWKKHNDLLAQFPPELVKELRAAMDTWNASTPEFKKQNPKPRLPYWPTSSQVPTRLYNGMIHGLAPYTLQGILWYQGESNASRYNEYGELIRSMVSAWRKDWGTDLPFYYVELAGLGRPQLLPVEAPPAWPFIREAQAGVLQLPKTGVATAVDLGMADDIHPPFKKPLGQRLAGLAAADVYGKEGLVRSPQFSGFKIESSKVRVTLAFADGLRTRDGGPAKGFAVRGADGQWKWAEAQIDGETVLVWNKEVERPEAVRYGWAGNPVLSLENGAGLPLRPFRTDSDSAQ